MVHAVLHRHAPLGDGHRPHAPDPAVRRGRRRRPPGPGRPAPRSRRRAGGGRPRGRDRPARVGRRGPRRAADRPGWSDRTTGCWSPRRTRLGGAERVVVPTSGRSARLARPEATFDGRDVFAPAAAHLALGRDPRTSVRSVDPGTLVRPGARRAEPVTGAGPVLVTAVGWVDRFGNLQLDVDPTRPPTSSDTPGRPCRSSSVRARSRGAPPRTGPLPLSPGFGGWIEAALGRRLRRPRGG